MARAPFFISGATASSRSKISPSAGSSRAFSRARELAPGMNNRLRRGRIAGFIETSGMIGPVRCFGIIQRRWFGRLGSTDRRGQMDDPNADSRVQDTGTAAWFGFWAQFIVLGLLAVAGALFASAGRDTGDYAT